MKKILVFLSSIILMSCSDDYDDSKLWNSINGLEDRVAKLEELCKQMNTNISSLQEIVTALQNSETIKSVSSLTDGTGYLITFSTGKTITIYHGKMERMVRMAKTDNMVQMELLQLLVSKRTRMVSITGQ